MKVKVEQKKSEFVDNFNKLLAVNKSNLAQFCKKYDLDYHGTRAKLTSKWIELDWYNNLCELVEQDSFNFNIELEF